MSRIEETEWEAEDPVGAVEPALSDSRSDRERLSLDCDLLPTTSREGERTD